MPEPGNLSSTTMATNSGKEKDALRDLLDKLETPAVRWALVCVGVVILVRLRLILFAAALPVMAYWHYSNHSEEPAAAAAGAGEDESPRAAAQDDQDDDAFDNDFGGGPMEEKDEEVYDKEFWSSDAQKGTRREGGDETKKDTKISSWDDGGAGDDFPPAKAGSSNMDDILGSLGTSFGGADADFGLGKMGDFDFLGSRGDDDDFLSGAMGGGFGSGKGGKGKGKKGDKGEKGDKGPREPNPKQLFVAGVGDMPEDEIRMFFEQEGEVERLKVLTNEDGSSKGVCFVTYREEEMAKQALNLHGTELNGKNITVRMANGGGKGKGEGKDGEKGFGKRDREPRMDFGPSERFGGAFGDSGDRPQGKGKGKGLGKRERGEMDDLLEEALADQEGPVKTSDFDAAARRFLSELKNRDRADGTTRCQEAIDNVIKFTCAKDRDSVRKWSAYVYTLLCKMDPQLSEEMRERDKARRQDKGGGRDRPPRDMTRGRDDDDRDRD